MNIQTYSSGYHDLLSWRAEELVAEIYRQRQELLRAGIFPRRVIMHAQLIRRLKIYHFLLGPCQGSMPDYLDSHSIFGLEFYVSNQHILEVSP